MPAHLGRLQRLDTFKHKRDCVINSRPFTGLSILSCTRVTPFFFRAPSQFYNDLVKSDPRFNWDICGPSVPSMHWSPMHSITSRNSACDPLVKPRKCSSFPPRYVVSSQCLTTVSSATTIVPHGISSLTFWFGSRCQVKHHPTRCTLLTRTNIAHYN